MKLLRYARMEKPHTESDLERRVKKLILIAKALASEIETLQAELRSDGKLNQFDFNKHGIDFYHEPMTSFFGWFHSLQSSHTPTARSM